MSDDEREDILFEFLSARAGVRAALLVMKSTRPADVRMAGGSEFLERWGLQAAPLEQRMIPALTDLFAVYRATAAPPPESATLLDDEIRNLRDLARFPSPTRTAPSRSST
jgi:hypothetical protein